MAPSFTYEAAPILRMGAATAKSPRRFARAGSKAGVGGQSGRAARSILGFKQLPYLDIKARGEVLQRFKGGIASSVFDLVQHGAADAGGKAELVLVQPRSLPLAAKVLAQNMLDARFHALSVRVLPENTVN